MTPALASDMFHITLMTAIQVGAPLLITMTVVAAVFGVIQAATQVQDASISFAPKLVGAISVIWFGAPWMASVLEGFMHKVLIAIPWMVAR
jgi:flagellar biosynthesis protein FliQ